MLKKALIVFSALLVLSSWANAHKFYTSLTQVEYNQETQSAEVIVNIFIDDLELAISNNLRRKITRDHKEFNKLCYQYIDTRFQLKDSKNQLHKNQYAGLEIKRDMVSIYFEIKLLEGLSNSHLKQVILLEANKEQTNIVNLKNGRNKTSLIFRAETPSVQTVNFGS